MASIGKSSASVVGTGTPPTTDQIAQTEEKSKRYKNFTKKVKDTTNGKQLTVPSQPVYSNSQQHEHIMEDQRATNEYGTYNTSVSFYDSLIAHNHQHDTTTNTTTNTTTTTTITLLSPGAMIFPPLLLVFSTARAVLMPCSDLPRPVHRCNKHTNKPCHADTRLPVRKNPHQR